MPTLVRGRTRSTQYPGRFAPSGEVRSEVHPTAGVWVDRRCLTEDPQATRSSSEQRGLLVLRTTPTHKGLGPYLSPPGAGFCWARP